MARTALITGASRGIGAATARVLSQEGYHVVINYLHSEQEANDLAASLKNAVAVRADVSKSQDVSYLVSEARRAFGKIDLLVNNAAIAEQKLFFDVTEEDWDLLFQVNLKSMFLLCKKVLPEMVQRRSGTIINLSSIWGMTGASCEVPYSAAKAGVIGFTKALAKEVGPSKVRVNAVAPGVIITDMNASLSEDTLTQLKEETPLCELGKAEDVANTIAFLASDKAAFITGQVISPNGGILI